MTNQKSIREYTFNTILNTKTHGVYNIIKAESSILKTIWICFFTICAVYCIYQVTNIIITFSAYGVNQVSSIVFESPAQFPAVVICNLNAYDSNTADDEIDSCADAVTTNKSANLYSRPWKVRRVFGASR